MQDIVTNLIKNLKNAIINDRACLFALIPCLPAVLLFALTCHQAQPFPDSGDYLALAQNLASAGQYKLSAADVEGTQALMRAPGYPALVAMGRVFAGDYGYFIVNVLCLYGIAFLVLKLAKEWHEDRGKWLLPLFLCTSPALVVLTSAALTEVPFTFWLMAGLYLLARKHPLAAGGCLSVATLIRPAGIYLFIPLSIWLLWREKKTLPVLVFIITANLLPLAWCTRNYVKTGYFTFTTMEGYYLLYYKAGSYLSWRENVPFDAMCARLDMQLTAKHPIERSRKAGALGKKIIRENLAGFACWAPRNLPLFLMPDINPLLERLGMASGNRGTLDILRRQGVAAGFKHYFADNPTAAVIALAYMAAYAASWLLLPFGLWNFYRRREFAPLLLAALCIAYFWVLPTGNLDWRFRVPALPLIFIFFTSGTIYLIEVCRKLSNIKRRWYE